MVFTWEVPPTVGGSSEALWGSAHRWLQVRRLEWKEPIFNLPLPALFLTIPLEKGPVETGTVPALFPILRN
jgi:hypothetical protein